MPIAHVSEIYFPEEARLRSETYGNIEELAESLAAYGQFQAILVRELDPGEKLLDGKTWILVDGGRRLRAAFLLAEKDRKIRGLDVGEIRYDQRGFAISDSLENLLHEYYANEEREDFSWAEKAKFVRLVHEQLSSRVDGAWPVDLTAKYLKMATSSVYGYLELTEDEEVFQDEEVQKADSFRSARKKVKIAKEKERRRKKAELRKKTEQGIEPGDYYGAALEMISQEDCREWIKQFDDESFDWIHWDPPYGGEQSGGAFALHEKIDDTEDYARELMEGMFPELERVLSPGGWMVIWFHQEQKEWIKSQLEALGLWINPYECIWYKRDRKADGHEITRYLTNAYEPFLLVGKPTDDGTLVLADSSPQNVFSYDMIHQSERRHVMHKPASLIMAILRVISLRGERGCDPSCGSGSSVEAAVLSGRPIAACELNADSRLAAVEAVAKTLEQAHIKVEVPPPVPDEFTI